MKKRFVLLISLFFLLSILSVHAIQSIYEVAENEVFPGSDLVYTMYITNDESSDMLIKLVNLDSEWTLVDESKLYPLMKEDQVIIPLVFKSATTLNRPRSGVITLLIKDGDTTKLNKLLPYQVLDYTKVLNAEFSEAPAINPLRGAILKLKVTNLNRVKLDGLNLNFKSSNFAFSKDFSLDKQESKVLEFPVKIPAYVVEGNYDADVMIKMSDREMLNIKLPYTISKYENVKDLVVPEDRLFYGGEILTKKNEGNTEVTQTYTKKFDTIAYKLSSFNPEPTKVTVTDNGYDVSWDVTLKPGETKTVSYVINYRMPLFVFVLILIVIAAWYVFRKRNVITIEKRVMAMHGYEGNLHVMKVVINIRNRGSTTINNVKLVDRIPNVIKAPTQYGIFKPNTVKAMPEGTVMVWDISSLRRGEEKILSYRLEGKPVTLHNVSLPPATVKYILFGRAVTAKSAYGSLKSKK